MSQEKAQLIAPQGHFTVPGLNVAGVVTASSFSGNCTGTASSITQGANVVVGVMTASSFAGDVFGNAAGLSTTTAGLKLGIVTATSFAGNFTGIGSGLTGTPNIVAGLVTASQFIGNTPGLAAGISAGKNLNAGIITATTFHGDGSGLTGAGSTAFIRQTVGSGTTIDLNDGNIILFEHANDTTVSFANTSTADDITIIRSLDPTDISFSTGGVDFDDSGDYLTIGSSSDFTMGTGDFTIESWVYPSSGAQGMYQISDTSGGFKISGFADTISVWIASDSTWKYNASGSEISTGVESSTGQWYHVALVRNSGTTSLYVNGSNIHSSTDTTNYNGTYIGIGGYYSTDYLWSGEISNFRIVKGRALYTTGFYPPSTALTNVADTKLLCCQSDSSTTTAAVTPGTITANGDPTAASQSITLSVSLGSAITWPSGVKWNGGSAPTLLGANSYSSTGQVFNLITYNGGTTWYGWEEVNNDASQPYQLYVWGENTYGNLGLNNRTSYSSPIQVPGNIWDGTTIDKLNKYGDSNGAGAWKTDGTIWVWGYSGYGEASFNTTGSFSSPVQFPGTTWALYAMGDTLAVATKTDGTLWSWGKSSYGALGLNQGPGNNVSSPIQIGSGTDWSTSTSSGNKVSAGTADGAAIKTDGTLWVWGRNLSGNLGVNSQIQYSSPVQVPGTTWSKLGQSVGSGLAIKTDNTLWAWGNNTTGWLGQNNTTLRSSPIQIPGSWSHVSGKRGNWVIGVKTDGTMWSWGSNNYGALGHNESAPAKKSSPTQIPGTTWSKCFSSSTHNAAIKTDGTVWAWGQDGGALGQNTATPRFSSPVQVPGTWGAIMGIGSRSTGAFIEY